MVFLHKSLEEKIYINVTLIVREMLLEGDVCLVTGTTGILILDFCMFLNQDQKYLAEFFVFLLMGSRHVTLGWLGTHCGDQAGLNLTAVLLPLPPKYEIPGLL